MKEIFEEVPTTKPEPYSGDFKKKDKRYWRILETSGMFSIFGILHQQEKSTI